MKARLTALLLALAGILAALTSFQTVRGALDTLSAPGVVESGASEQEVAIRQAVGNVDRDWAPFVLAAYGVFLLGVAGTTVLALAVLATLGTGARRWLIRAAVVVCLARLGVGVIDYQRTQASMEAAGQAIATAMTRGPPPATLAGMKQRAQASDQVQNLVEKFGGAASALPLLWTLVAAAFWLLLGLSFVRLPPAPPPPSS